MPTRQAYQQHTCCRAVCSHCGVPGTHCFVLCFASPAPMQAGITWRVQFAVGTAICLAVVAYRWTLLQVSGWRSCLVCRTARSGAAAICRQLATACCLSLHMPAASCFPSSSTQESKVWKAERHDVAEQLAQKGVGVGQGGCLGLGAHHPLLAAATTSGEVPLLVGYPSPPLLLQSCQPTLASCCSCASTTASKSTKSWSATTGPECLQPPLPGRCAASR